MRTPMACCGSTSRRVQTCPPIAKATWMRSRSGLIPGQEKPLAFKRQELPWPKLLRSSIEPTIRRLQKEGYLARGMEHRTSKYLNNIIEADHGALKRVIRPTCGFQSMKTARATIKGFEVKRMIRRGHCRLPGPGATGEIRLVNQLFGLAA